MEHYKITLHWKGLPQEMNLIDTFIVNENELYLLEQQYRSDISIDVWDTTTIKRKYEFVDIIRSIDSSSKKVFGALIYRDLIKKSRYE
jgi:hypothetical protein